MLVPLLLNTLTTCDDQAAAVPADHTVVRLMAAIRAAGDVTRSLENENPAPEGEQGPEWRGELANGFATFTRTPSELAIGVPRLHSVTGPGSQERLHMRLPDLRHPLACLGKAGGEPLHPAALKETVNTNANWFRQRAVITYLIDGTYRLPALRAS